ncbi:MAG: tetratricopeptide repeat protein [Acidobacteria bacterium]|nr:tetratricopeptide repeat protein [Acidobacteriota bacterium]
MKRTERHHLKENEFAEWLLGAREWYGANRNLVIYGGLAIIIVAIGVVATVIVRQNTASTATRMLAEAMVIAEAPVMPPTAGEAGKPPMQATGTYASDKARLEAALPSLLAVADSYPNLEPGVMARYRAAAALVAVGRTADGIERYREVVAKAKGVYQVMAKLGIADAQLTIGQYEPALASLKEIAQQTTDEVPVDGVLMQLARGYRLAGKNDEARKTFRRVADEFPQSPYAQIARREMDALDIAPAATR